MSRTFRDCSREAYQRDGIPGLLGLWMFTTMDSFKAALQERGNTGEWFMSKETVIRIGSPAMILAGVLWIIGSIDSFDSLTWLLMFPALIALWIGLLALNAYSSSSSTRVMRGASILALAANALALLGYVAGSIYYQETQWFEYYRVLVLSLTVLFSSLLVLGVVLLREPLLPRWGGPAILLSLPLVVFLLSRLPWLFELVAWSEAPRWLESSVFMLAGLGLLLLGYAMLPLKGRAAAPAQT
jgi:hypothetical protein